MSKLSRRGFILTSSASVAGSSVAAVAAETPPAMPPVLARASTLTPVRSAAPPAWRFFTEPEGAVVSAAVGRLIPADELGPGAQEAGVPAFIDGQLAGAWGAGERLYRSGPWLPGAPTQGYQLPFTPAELFRTALRGLGEQLQRSHGASFDALSGEVQDTVLTELQTTSRDLAGVPANVFFATLWEMTLEGYFSDPVYGGNRDMGSWRMIGFPGAYGSFYELVDRHGLAFNMAPRSLGERSGQVHVMPDIPAVSPVPTGRTDGHGRGH